MRGLKDIDYVLQKLAWMRAERIWPNGLRYLWTDAFGVVLLASLYESSKEQKYLDEALWVVAEVKRVLGRKRGIRIGEEPDRDGQYFHYLSMWLYALHVLSRFDPKFKDEGVALARDIHAPFVIPGRGVIWKMQEDLSGPYPGYGFGALDAFDGYVSYRLLDEEALAPRDRRDAGAHQRDGRRSRHHPGSRARHDAVDDAVLPARGLGGDPARALARHARPHVDGRKAISPGSPICRRCASPSPITACRWACRRWTPCRSASMRSMPISTATARATSTTAPPSRT